MSRIGNFFGGLLRVVVGGCRGGRGGGSIEVKRAGGAGTRTLDDVQVDHGGFDAGMAEQGLDGPDVGVGFEEVGGKGMPEGMAGGPFGDVRFAEGLLELALHGAFVKVVTGDAPRAGMRAQGSRGKDILPGPFAGGVGPFAQQGLGHVDIAGADYEVLAVFFTG